MQHIARKESETRYGELGVFHSLHCLNMLRMSIDRDYYESESTIFDKEGWPVGYERAHIGMHTTPSL